MLCHTLCGISSYVPPGDPAFFQIIFIQIIGACRRHTDQFQIFCFFQCRLIDRYLVDHDHIRVRDPFRRLLGRGIVIPLYFSKRIKAGQIDVRPDRCRIQKYDLHFFFSPSVSPSFFAISFMVFISRL